MKNKTSVVCNTKGGAGKSIISSMILPTIFLSDNVKINIYEIDNNNISQLENSKINFNSIKIEKTEETINNVYFDLISGTNEINIVDCGGGDDTVAILKYLNKVDIKNLTYLVPINDDIEQLQNALQTIDLVKEIDKEAKIFLILNRCSDIANQNSIKEQFISIFGSKKYGIDPSLHLIENIEILFVPNSQIFGILKNIYKTSLYDFASEAKDLVDNIDKYRPKWVKNGKEQFNDNMNRYAFAKDTIELIVSLKNLNIVKGEL